MSYANYFELTKCLKDCLAYCHAHPEREHAKFHEPLIRGAQEDLKRTTEKSDKEFTEWRMESRVDKLAWKHLARQLATVQKKLRQVNAIGFLDQKVMYWNIRPLLAAVDEMIEYLDDRRGDLDFATDAIDKLERQKERALSEGDQKDRALDDYMRFSQMRADALTACTDVIANFRRALRRDLGTRDEEYQKIDWPHQVASDEKVL